MAVFTVSRFHPRVAAPGHVESLIRGDRKNKRRRLNCWVVLCVIVGSGGRAAGMTMFGSEMRRFGELEAVIMDQLWEWGRPVLVREMVDALRDDRAPAYTTVMTVMENLYRKGWLRRERDGRAWRYEPTRSRSSYTAALMSDALATSPDRRTALTHFALQMSPYDAALLREALDQALGEREAGESR
jgi:predicted transcriptional regulator